MQLAKMGLSFGSERFGRHKMKNLRESMMKGTKRIGIFFAAVVMVVFSGTTVFAEYHNVSDCTVCHYSGENPTQCKDSPNLMLIRDSIEWPPGSAKPTVFEPYVVGQPLVVKRRGLFTLMS